MAKQVLSPFYPLVVCRQPAFIRMYAWLLAFVFIPFTLTVPPADAQTPQQQYAYGSSTPGSTGSVVNVLSKNGLTGSLSPILNSPFPERSDGGPMAIDALGRFLFVLNRNASTITMFQIDSNTGALSEVHDSPFATGPTLALTSTPSNPRSLATEKGGKFLYVGFKNGSAQGAGEIDKFTIDAVNLKLVPGGGTSGGGFLLTTTGPVMMVSEPKGRALYAFLGFLTSAGFQNAELNAYSIDAVSGNLSTLGTINEGQHARSLALDPKGRFVYTGHGLMEGQFEGTLLSPVDGSLGSSTGGHSLGVNVFPQSMAVEGSGQYLYISTTFELHIFSMDPSSGAPTEVPKSPQSFAQVDDLIADPTGPYLYATCGGSVCGYRIDLQTGLLTQLPDSPFAGGGGNLAISGTPVQAVSGPVAALFPGSVSFGSVVENMPSTTQVVEIVSNGGQALTLNANAIGFSGAAAGDFTQKNTCQLPAVLQPGKSCSVSITFTPSAPGTRQATLTVTDNAPGSPQTAALSGTGLVPTPGVTLIPGNLTYTTITEGTLSGVQSVTLTSSGNVPLNISSMALSGANPTDFRISPSGCTQLQVNAACTINVTFAPLAAGGRSATILINDDAPGSPQMTNITGSANPAVTVAAAQNGSMSASVSAGQTAQYNLQITPGANYSGNVSLACTGAPIGASCRVSPSMVAVSNGVAAPFMVLVSTSGGAAMLPFSNPPNDPPLPPAWLVLIVFAMLFTLLFHGAKRFPALFGRRFAFGGVLSLTALFVVLAAAGCGGGSAAPALAPPPPPIVTPQGTSTLTVTPMAANSDGQALQLQPIQLTLTVK